MANFFPYRMSLGIIFCLKKPPKKAVGIPLTFLWWLPLTTSQREENGFYEHDFLNKKQVNGYVVSIVFRGFMGQNYFRV